MAQRAEVQARRVELRTIKYSALDLEALPARLAGFQNYLGPVTFFPSTFSI